MTDLERFVELYRSFGVECIVNEEADGTREIILSEISTYSEGRKVTTSDKFEGYSGFGDYQAREGERLARRR